MKKRERSESLSRIPFDSSVGMAMAKVPPWGKAKGSGRGACVPSSQSSQSATVAAGQLLRVLKGVDRRVASMTGGTVRTPRALTRSLYEKLDAPLNLATFGEALLPSTTATWPVFETQHGTPPVTWAKTHRPDWLLDVVEGLHVKFHDPTRMESLICEYGRLSAIAHDISPVGLIRRAELGGKVAHARITHGLFDHSARAVLHLMSSMSASFRPRLISKEHATLSLMPALFKAIDDASTISNTETNADFFLAPSLDNGSQNQVDEVAALDWLFQQGKIYKYLQLQLLLSLFGKHHRLFATIGGTKFSVSDPRARRELNDALRGVDIYAVCSEKLISGVLQSPFASQVRAVTMLPTTKPLASLHHGAVDAFATQLVQEAERVQNNRPLIILSQCAGMNSVVAARLLESSMSHVALIDIGRALEILVGGHKASAGTYSRSTGHVGKFTYLVPVNSEKWRARRERIQV